MKISQNWLGDFISIAHLAPEELEEVITTKIAEVDSFTCVGSCIEKAQWVMPLEIRVHPKSKKLKIVKVSDGKSEIEIVCGALNIPKNALLACVFSGDYFFHPLKGLRKVEKRAIAGIHSPGMLVSEAELEINHDSNSLCSIPINEGVNPGESVSGIWGSSDWIYEIDNKSLTHRPDLWGHAGFARELSACMGISLAGRVNQWSTVDLKTQIRNCGLEWRGKSKEIFRSEVIKGSGCRRFAGLVVELKSTPEDTAKMKRRLFSIGHGVHSPLVNISNYVMSATGQPNHFYDLDKLSGNVLIARFAQKGEEFIALDGESRKLSDRDVVIADSEAVVALGGIIGGDKSSVSHSTSKLFIESANFDPLLVRETSKRLNLRTDSSLRFEKNRNPNEVPSALCEILRMLGDAGMLVGAVSDSYPESYGESRVNVSVHYICNRLGGAPSEENVNDILYSLGFEKGSEDFLVPPWRGKGDISTAEDLVEEVGRIYGYENIPERSPLLPADSVERNATFLKENQAREILSAKGFSEVYLYSFANKNDVGSFEDKAVLLHNAVDSNFPYMRTSLIPGLLNSLEENLRRENTVALFEVGRTYLRNRAETIVDPLSGRNVEGVKAIEERKVAATFFSSNDEKVAGSIALPPIVQGAAFFSMADVFRQLVYTISGADCEFLNCLEPPDWAHPFRCAKVFANKHEVGFIAEIIPGKIPLKGRGVAFECDLGTIMPSKVTWAPFSKFPCSFFEISVVAPEDLPFAKLQKIVSAAVSKNLLYKMEVVSIYRGEPLAKEEKSISIKFHFASSEGTISSQELNDLQNAIVKKVDSSGLRLRG